MEKEQADAGRDGRARLARPNNSQARTGKGNIQFPCSTDHEKDWQTYPVDPYIISWSTVMNASFHCCGTFPSRQMRVVSRWSSSRMVRSRILLKSEFQQFRGKAIRPLCVRVCHCLHHCGNYDTSRESPRGTEGLV